MAMSADEQAAFLAGLGLAPEGKTLADVPAAEVSTEAPAKKAKKKEVPTTTRPEDPSDIVYDAAWVSEFVLDGSDMKAASDKLFAMFRYPRGDVRNKLLHRLNTEFLQRVKKERNPQPRDGHIKDKVKASKDDRDLAAMIASAGITADDLAVMIEALKASKA